MKSSLARIAELRATLQRQARVALAAAEHDLAKARETAEQIAQQSVTDSLEGPVSASALQLSESMGAAARAAAAVAQRDRDAKAAAAVSRTRETRQIEVLVERVETRERKEQNVREQRESDDRAQHRRVKP